MEDDVPKEEESLKKPGGEPLTKKQELNNHIVLMRKVVRRARVHLINKLTKELKKLKEYKGTDPKAKEKASRKAERLLQEVKVIQHLKEDKVSIFALQDSKKQEEVLQNLQSSVEDRALSRLGHHPFVQVDVNKYREKNPHWKLQIPVLLEKSKEKRRLTDKKLREREAAKLNGNFTPIKPKAAAAVDANKSAEESESASNSDKDTTEPEELSADSGSSEEISEEEEDIPEKPETEPTTPKEVQPSKPPTPIKVQPPTPTKVQPSKPAAAKSVKPVKNNKPANTKKPTPASVPPKIDKTKGTVRIKVLNCLEDLEEDEEAPLLVPVISSTSLDPPIKKRPKSSFFVGGEDEPEDVEEERKRKERPVRKPKFDSSSSEFKPVFRKGKLVNKPPKNFGKPQKPDGGRPGKFSDSSSNLVPLGENKKSDKQSQGPRSLLNPQSASESEKLHPSWEAKKRQQISLSNFKGKKITFGDDE